MKDSRGIFSEANRRKPVKLCGNCSRVSFGLNKEETDFLNLITLENCPETIRTWLRKGRVKRPGSPNRLDPEKTRAIELISKSARYCKVAGATVRWNDFGCYLWQPASEN